MLDSVLVSEVCNLARIAGEQIAEMYSKKNFTVKLKKDNSPVTTADLLAHDMIYNKLQEISSIPIVSEENEEHTIEKNCWLVDPLDGTKEFVAGRTHFTVNIAYIEDYYPIFGVIYFPLGTSLYWGGENFGAFKLEAADSTPQKISTRNCPEERGILLKSRNANISKEEVLIQKELSQCIVSPMASSFKFCLLAEGKADVFLRGLRTYTWDTGAGQAILEGANGAVTTFSGERLCYDRKFNNNFLAVGDKSYITPLAKKLG